MSADGPRPGRRVVAYLGASVPSRMAGSGLGVALPVLALQEVGELAVGGLLVAVALAPSVIAAPIVGVVLDRAARPGRLIGAMSLLAGAALTLAAFLGSVPLPLVVSALVIAGAVTPFFMGGLSSLVADVIAGERRAYAQDALSYNLAGVAGPGLVAVLVTLAPARWAMLALAVLALIGGGVACLLSARRREAALEGRGVLRSMAEGLRYLTRHRPLAVVTASGTLSQLGAGALPIAAVALALTRTDGSEAGAWIVTSFSIGALIGSLAAAAFGRSTVAPQVVMAVGFLVTGLATLAVLPDLGLPAALAAIAVSGFASAPATAAMLLLRKQHSPDGVRAQVFTVGAGLRASAAALGAALAGFASGSPDLLFVFVAAGWITSAVVLTGFPRTAAAGGPVERPSSESA